MTEKEQVKIRIEDIKLNAWNPNVQKDTTFNALVENIEEIGMVEPVMVLDKDEDGKYLMISGEHRYEACKILGYTEVPAYVMDSFDEDMAKFQTVRMNVLKGKLDPIKFTKLFDDMADKYGKELTKQMMALVDEKEFDNLYVNVRKELPKEMQDKLDSAKDEIKTVDDLSRILNEMFNKYGDTLKQNFMVFQYGGKTHVWVIMDKALKNKFVDGVLEELHAGGYDINRYLDKLITDYSDAVINEMSCEEIEVEE